MYYPQEFRLSMEIARLLGILATRRECGDVGGTMILFVTESLCLLYIFFVFTQLDVRSWSLNATSIGLLSIHLIAKKVGFDNSVGGRQDALSIFAF